MKLEHLVTKDQKLAGLQFRESLDEDTVLVFWDVEKGDNFATQNCKFPFDIAFLGKRNEILNIKTLDPVKNEVAYAPKDTVLALEAGKGILGSYKNSKRFYLK